MPSPGLLIAPLLKQVTSGTSASVFALPYRDLTLYVVGIGTITAGTLFVEEAILGADLPNQDSALLGSWSNWSQIPIKGTSTGTNFTIDLTQVTGGSQLAYQFPRGAYGQVRVRIGTSVTGAGGAVSTILVGH